MHVCMCHHAGVKCVAKIVGSLFVTMKLYRHAGRYIIIKVDEHLYIYYKFVCI